MISLRNTRLFNQVAEEIRNFRWNLSRLEALDFSTPGPTNLIQGLREEVDAIEKNLAEIRQYFHDFPDLTTHQLCSCHRKISARIPLLGYIERAQAQHTPWSLIESIRELASDIIPDYRVVIASVDAHNYVVEWNAGSKRLFLLLPRLHRLNVLWHTNIGHELFHPALEQFFQDTSAEVTSRIADECKKIIQSTRSKEEELDLFGAKRLVDIADQTSTMWKRGISEILCDFGCALLFGPAAVMALLSMGLSDDLDAAPKAPLYYPPWRFRFRAVHDRIFSLCKAFSQKISKEHPGLTRYTEAFDESLEEFDQIIAKDSDTKKLDAAPLHRIAYAEVRRNLDAGWGYIQTLVPPTVKCWNKVQDQVPPLLERLERRVPPCEISISTTELAHTPAELSAILVAGWIYESYWQKERIAGGKFEYPTLMRLILKGCEDAALLRSHNLFLQSKCQ